MKNHSRRNLNKKEVAYRMPSRFLANKPQKASLPVEETPHKGSREKKERIKYAI
ncbi:MAG: hypothetical protein PHD51_01995 [Patescibacteria group bacterium]|nr:hypothetical protein [Patescibacteria group bacterium]MDD5490368.1 hypothetical protein [Patescibacteria group bacterium]